MLGFLLSLVLVSLLFVVAMGLLSLLRLYFFLKGGISVRRHRQTRTSAPQRRKKSPVSTVSKKIVEGGEYVDYEEMPQDGDSA